VRGEGGVNIAHSQSDQYSHRIKKNTAPLLRNKKGKVWDSPSDHFACPAVAD